jgi:hypothetical protein
VKIIHVQLPIIKTRLPKPSKIEYLADEWSKVPVLKMRWKHGIAKFVDFFDQEWAPIAVPRDYVCVFGVL